MNGVHTDRPVLYQWTPANVSGINLTLGSDLTHKSVNKRKYIYTNFAAS